MWGWFTIAFLVLAGIGLAVRGIAKGAGRAERPAVQRRGGVRLTSIPARVAGSSEEPRRLLPARPRTEEKRRRTGGHKRLGREALRAGRTAVDEPLHGARRQAQGG